MIGFAIFVGIGLNIVIGKTLKKPDTVIGFRAVSRSRCY